MDQLKAINAIEKETLTIPLLVPFVPLFIVTIRENAARHNYERANKVLQLRKTQHTLFLTLTRTKMHFHCADDVCDESATAFFLLYFQTPRNRTELNCATVQTAV